MGERVAEGRGSGDLRLPRSTLRVEDRQLLDQDPAPLGRKTLGRPTPVDFRPTRSLVSLPLLLQPQPLEPKLHTMSGLISSTIDSIRGTSGGKSKLLKKSPDDGESRRVPTLGQWVRTLICLRGLTGLYLLAVVVTMASRTPLQRARKGGFKDMSVQELLIAFFKVGHALPSHLPVQYRRLTLDARDHLASHPRDEDRPGPHR